ncbi:MAG: L,D-transpeptidase [Cyanobacteriota bacterium]
MGRLLRPLATSVALACTALLAAPRGAGAVEPPPPLPPSSTGAATTVVTLPAAQPVPAQPAPAQPASPAPTGTAQAASATPATALPAATPTAQPPATAALTANREILLELGKRTISLVENGKVLGSWPVAVGDPSTPTPTGRFAVRNKVVNPQYQSTVSGKNNPTIGPQGPLGDRWIGFHTTTRDQFGIHGTPTAWEWTVRSRAAVSHGCVRMLTPHVRELFDKVDVGTPVVVKP